MSRPAFIHICPHCKKTSTEFGAFQKIVHPSDIPLEIDGFRFCSARCRLQMDEDGPDFVSPQFKIRRQGLRSFGFRKDRLIDS